MEFKENELMVYELETHEVFGATKLDAANYLKSITDECIDKYSARNTMLTVRELAKDLTSEVECERKAIEEKIETQIDLKLGSKSFYSLLRKCANQ